MFVTFWLVFPLAPPALAQDAATGPAEAYVDQVIAALEAGQPNPAILAGIVDELARQRAAGTLDQDWVPVYVLQVSLLLAETNDPAAALALLAEAEALVQASPAPDPLYRDWIGILRALRWAEMGRLTEAADLLEPLLPSAEAIYGADDHATLEAAVPQWREQGRANTFDAMLSNLETANDAMQRGDLRMASDAARAVLLPLDQVAEDDTLAFTVVQAYLFLSMVETQLGNHAAAADLALQGVIYLTSPPWDGQATPPAVPQVRALALQNPDFMALAIPALQIAAQTTNEVGNTATALLMRSGLERLGQSPAIADALGVIDRAIAAKSGDLDATVESARAAVALLEPQRETDPEGYRVALFELALMEALAAEKAGAPVDFDGLMALVAADDGTKDGWLATNLQGIVTVADQVGAHEVTLALAGKALHLRARTAAALTLSEQARDQFLRDGRSLTESWLNAAFALTRTQQEAAPTDDDLSLVCSDATPTSFCVMWRYDGSVSNPAR